MEFSLSQKESFIKYCQKRMSSKKEFIQLFYQVLYQSAAQGRDVTHYQVFKALNQLYFNVTGKYRFKDYESFYFTKIRMDNIALRNLSFV